MYHKPMPEYEHQKTSQYEEEMSVALDKETKDKDEELERQLKQNKGTDSLEVLTSMIFSYIQD